MYEDYSREELEEVKEKLLLEKSLTQREMIIAANWLIEKKASFSCQFLNDDCSWRVIVG